MTLDRLRVAGLRSLAAVDIAPGRGLNVLLGDNGAGKTSVLEGIFLLSHGRSFRGGGAEVLTARGADGFSVYAELCSPSAGTHRVGLGRTGGRWQVQVDGAAMDSRSALVGLCPAVCFEPGSHALISAGSERRRRFMDWGVFHVEQGFFEHWRRYQRALRQRNRLLRGQPAATELAPWEMEMAAAAGAMDHARGHYMAQLEPVVRDEAQRLAPELGACAMSYQPGWPTGTPLVEALVGSRERDRSRGHSTIGAHRADWQLVFEHAPLREHLSRGQEKLVVLACVLAQARRYAMQHGDWPIVCLDDLGSELDNNHRASLIARLHEAGAQTWVSGTERPAELADAPHRVFHVEHGRVRAGD